MTGIFQRAPEANLFGESALVVDANTTDSGESSLDENLPPMSRLSPRSFLEV